MTIRLTEIKIHIDRYSVEHLLALALLLLAIRQVLMHVGCSLSHDDACFLPQLVSLLIEPGVINLNAQTD